MEVSKVFTKVQTLNNGLTIPQVGFGCYQVKESDPFYWAVKYGYRHLDSAAFYQNEAQVGNEARRAMSEFGLKREDIFITSKIFNDHMGYELTKKQVEVSLKNFDLGYIDMMLIHFPGTAGLPKDDPMHLQNRKESWKALEEYVDSGLIKSIGVSNYRPHHIEELVEYARIKPVVNQFELHPLYVEYDTIETCRKHNILVQSYSPFAQFKPTITENEVLKGISVKYNLDIARVILLWHIANGFNVLPKSATEERIKSNIELEGLALSEEDLAQINELGQNNRFKVCWDPKDYA
ncbi:aldo keto reductase [Stylonychia lemnae]|uniref:Aldo keto reductase n=1 Tax=Stylonychia lemnae TaxID=5949 RepID=A0A078B599_STYLE|nr:aldo keto reductase [Stylonychia lemnae]|eukprot:CDW88713.1 aldo keto reductase [Stylonychia lemnae]